MGRKVDVDDLVSAAEIADRLGCTDRNIAHSWLRRYPDFPRPVARMAIGHVWAFSEVARWAAKTGRGRWDELPPRLDPDRLVPLRAWAAENDVPPVDLIDIAAEGRLLLAKRGGRFYLDPEMAATAWAKHGERLLAKHLVVPRRTRR